MTYIIVLNYNGASDTLECLESLNNIQEEYKIVLIDNKSTDDSVNELEKWIQVQSFYDGNKLVFIQSDENNGYAAGNNIGIKFVLEQKDAKFIWILNNDTKVYDTSLAELLKTYNVFQKKLKIGFIGSKILDYSKPEMIQSSGIKRNCIGKRVDRYRNKSSSFLINDTEVDDICGCSVFFSKDIISDIGLMPEEYFLYYEETDWMYRASLLSYHNFTSANSIIYHKEGKSTGGQLSPFVIYYMTRNRILYSKKYKNFATHIIFMFFYFNYSILKVIKFYFKNKKVSRSIFLGLFDGIKGITGNTYQENV
ncbi:MAG: glycosyltransferase family 2 protein [Sulfurospirillum sp.]|nr:glycosyltransferase family 2 protein [Sulfurospirillum sp.]